MPEPLLYALATYLLASVSFPQLIARAHGVDLHRVGSRNLGAGNLWREVGALQGATGGLFDALKAPLAMLLALALGASRETQILCGAVAVVAQQWPLWHRFDGGRGNATAFAYGIALSLRTALVALPILLVVVVAGTIRRGRGGGRFTRVTPLAALAGIVLYPVIAAALGEDAVIVVTALVTGALVVVRRLTANLRQDLALSEDLGRILLNRLLYDRTETQRRAVAPEE